MNRDTPKVHKATPADVDAGMTSCIVCKEQIRPVTGGQGRTWVHHATGSVAAAGAAPDNTTHHLVTGASGAQRCTYCRKDASELGPEPTKQPCPAAPK